MKDDKDHDLAHRDLLRFGYPLAVACALILTAVDWWVFGYTTRILWSGPAIAGIFVLWFIEIRLSEPKK